MAAVLALTPILIAIALLLLKQSSWIAALAGAVAAAAIVALAFPTPASVLVGSGVEYFPLIVEVALILLFGMVLARLLEAAGSMSQISSWFESLSPNRPLGVPLVVFGIVAFADSVTGFCIGVTSGVLLARRLEAAGSMSPCAAWFESPSPSRPLAVALVVFGIVPFAESVTGFGIGVTIGVPILRHLGCTLRQSALLGLLGLIAVPW